MPVSARALAVLLSLALLPATAPLRSSAQEPPAPAAGVIEMLEPQEWRGSGERGVVARAKRSLRVVGVALHPAGIQEVRLNGERAALQTEPGGGVRFTGFVPLQADTREVEVTAYPVTGRLFSRRYDLSVLPAEQGVQAPSEAWQGSTGKFRGQRWAVVIGISDYQDSRVPALRYADDDAQAIYDFLVSERAGLGGFKPENIQLLLNQRATFRGIRSALFSFLRGATENDVVFIFFAGHGAADPGRLEEYYLLANDSDVTDLPATALRMSEVNEAVRQVYYHDLVVIADACHSAGVGGQVGGRDFGLNQINRLFLDGLEGSTGGYVIFTASQVNQQSREDARWGGGHGVFTHFLLEGLQGAADEDGDQIVTLGEATEFVRDRVRRETRNAQIPTTSQTAFDMYLPLALVPTETIVTPEAPGAMPLDSLRLSAVDTAAVTARPPAEAVDSAEAVALGAVRFNPGAALIKSLMVPGLGQITTDRPTVGLAFLAAAGGALALGLTNTRTAVVCATPGESVCPSNQVISSTVSRPYLIPSLVATAAIALISAIEARAGAIRANGRPSEGGRATGPTVLRWDSNQWSVRPALIGGLGGVGLQVARRF